MMDMIRWNPSRIETASATVNFELRSSTTAVEELIDNFSPDRTRHDGRKFGLLPHSYC
jgi:hypothetical protein